MSYGRLGQQGFTRLGSMAQALSAPPQGLSGLPKTNEVPEDPEDVAALSGDNSNSSFSLARRLLGDERDSNSRGDELSGAMPGSVGEFDSRFVSAEPGAVSLMGLSSGTAFDKAGRGYDTTNLDMGALAGGLAGGFAGPIGGAIGGLAGRQADANLVLGANRNRGLLGSRTNNQNYSRGERTAQQEWRNWWNNRNPAAVQAAASAQGAVGTPQLERLLTQARQQRENSDSNTQHRSTGRPDHQSSTGPGRQTVSGASRNSGFNGNSYGDRGRSI